MGNVNSTNGEFESYRELASKRFTRNSRGSRRFGSTRVEETKDDNSPPPSGTFNIQGKLGGNRRSRSLRRQRNSETNDHYGYVPPPPRGQSTVGQPASPDDLIFFSTNTNHYVPYGTPLMLMLGNNDNHMNTNTADRKNRKSSTSSSEQKHAEEYLFAEPDLIDTKRFACKSGATVQSTSILTFHGPNHEQWNVGSSSSSSFPYSHSNNNNKNKNNNSAGGQLQSEGEVGLNDVAPRLPPRPSDRGSVRCVCDGDEVTVFANINQEASRYLSVSGRSSSRLEWSSNTGPGVLCRFVVRGSSYTRQNDKNNNNNVHAAPLLRNETITLESLDRPGCYVSAASTNGAVYLSSFDMGTFTIKSPELRHLVNLNRLSQPKSQKRFAAIRGRNSSGASGSVSPRSKSRRSRRNLRWSTPSKTRRASESNNTAQVTTYNKNRDEKSTMERYLGEMPLDVLFHLLSYHGQWVRTARLVCRDWCRAAELYVGKIRVNGDFACLTTRTQRRELVSFANRCRNLQTLSLRNIVDLSDNDFEHLTDAHKLVSLDIGGCARVSDGSVEAIAKLQGLTHLNLAATSITDSSLTLLSTALPKLECLNLYACQNITDEGVSQVANMRKLSSVNLRGTDLNRDFTDRVQAMLPNLLVLTGPLLQDGIY